MAHAEDLLISAIVRTGDMKEAIRQGITRDMFRLRKKEFDWVVKFFERNGSTPSGVQYRAKFPDVPTYKVVGVGSQCDEFKKYYAKRALSSVLDETVRMMMNGEITKAVSGLGSKVFGIQAKIADAPDDYNAGNDWQDTVDEVKRRVDSVAATGMAGIPTGFPTLDNVTGGLQAGWLCVIGGRLGQGKTYTTIKMAVEAACAGHKVAYFSLEQSRHQIAIRSHAFFATKFNGGKVFPPQDLIRGVNVDIAEYAKFLGKVGRNLQGSFVINDSRRGRITPMSLAAAIERHGHDIVFVDYFTLMDSGGDGGWLNLANMSADIKQVAERYQVPIVLVSQLNRQEGQGLGTARLSRTDSLGQDAELVMIIHQKSEHVINHRLEKFRHGQDGQRWSCEYDPSKGIYKEVSGNRAEQIMQRDQDVD